MKNTFKLLGIIATLAVISFSMAACKDDVSDVELAGTSWKYESRVLVGGADVGPEEKLARHTYTITFITASEFQDEEYVIIIADESTLRENKYSGTYTISGNSGTMNFINPDAGNVFQVWQFEVNGDELKMTRRYSNGTTYYFGTFAKQ